ncbi:uncharacterized protein O9250_010043 [Rhynochetos jubatus]
MENAGETTPGSAVGGPSSPAETREEEESTSLAKGVTAPSGSSETTSQRVAGSSSKKPQNKKKKNKSKKKPSSSGEQDSLPRQSTESARTTELPGTCVTPREIQTPGSEVAQPGAEVLVGDSGGAHERDGALGHLGKEAGSLEAVAEGRHSSVDALTPPKQSGTDSVAAPPPNSAAPKEKNKNKKEKKKTPVEKVTEKTNQPQKPGVAGKDDASAGRGNCKDKKHQWNQQPAEKLKEKWCLAGSCSRGHVLDSVLHLVLELESDTKCLIKRKEVALISYSSEQAATQLPVARAFVDRSNGVTVYFHAVLSKDFKLNPEIHKVFIRAEGISPYADWQDNICELSCTKIITIPMEKEVYGSADMSFALLCCVF